jgi:hypothetical protein
VVEYLVAPAEASGLESQSADLVAVAPALHWFDLDRFPLHAEQTLCRCGRPAPNLRKSVDWGKQEVRIGKAEKIVAAILRGSQRNAIGDKHRLGLRSCVMEK